MLEVHRSNRADLLVDHLAGRLAEDPLPDPMVPERIGVQSRGMARWLSHHLAERLGADGNGGGITANVGFPFPGTVIDEVIAACVADGVADETHLRWRPDRLVWAVLDLIPALEAPGAERVRGYFRDEGGIVGRRRWGLSRRIADVLDRYAMFRPEMVKAWADGEVVGPDGAPLDRDQLWQPELWRRLEDRLGPSHLASRFETAVTALRGEIPIDGLPPRLTLFGTSALAPSYLELLSALATRIDVSLYIIVPSPVLWGRISAAAEQGAPIEDDGVRPQHPLLVSSGRLAQDFQRVLERRAEHTGRAMFEQPDHATALGRLQSDLLGDIDRGDLTRSGSSVEPAELDPEDRSIQFHACHGPGRQVEVLHDRLLHLFQDDPSLEPRDVIVMTSDIEAYAPLVTAVFGRDAADGRAIPYRLADRTLRGTNHVAAALLDILDLASGRFTASAVGDLISRDPIRRAAGLSEDDVGRIQGWIAASGIRWGIDPAHRVAHGQPADRDHTWRAGLDRLLLGVAMPDEEDRHVDGVVPYDDMEGGDVDLLGRFVGLCDRLFRSARALREPRPLDAWVDVLTGIVEGLTAVDEDRRWVRDDVIDLLGELIDRARSGDDAETLIRAPLSADAIRALLGGAAQDPSRRAAYETGAVTFCAMIPMRSIPHRVVCLLGMDDGAFPGRARPAGFDLMAHRPRTGDRDPSGEDRLLFLEAILAARDHLVILYTGRDQRTNEERAPAVPVGELGDALDRAHVHHPDDRTSEHHPLASARLTTEHPLQAFSPRNFDRSSPLSFADEQLAAACVARSGETQPWRFFPDPLPEEDQPHEVIELAQLRTFLRNPTAWLYTNRLGMWLREERRDIADTEPLEAGGLESWRIGDSLLEAGLEHEDREARTAALLGRGTVPTGALGAYAVGEVQQVVDRIEEELRDVAPALLDRETAGPARDLPIDVRVGDRRLHGIVRGIRADVLLEVQYSNLAPRHRLGLWVRHLALALVYPDEPIRSVIVGRKKAGAKSCVYAGTPPEVAEEHLTTLLDIFERGRREPVPLFDASSEAYAKKMFEAGGDGDARTRAHASARAAARGKWDSDYGYGDLSDEHVAHCYGEDCGFDDAIEGTDFDALAEAVWSPILAAEAGS